MTLFSRLSPAGRLAPAAAVLVVAVALSACGRYGEPLPPPGPNAPSPSPSATPQKSVFLPGGGLSTQKAPPLPKPTPSPFVLDPLLN